MNAQQSATSPAGIVSRRRQAATLPFTSIAISPGGAICSDRLLVNEPAAGLRRREQFRQSCIEYRGLLAGDGMSGPRDHHQRRGRRRAFQKQAACETRFTLVSDEY